MNCAVATKEKNRQVKVYRYVLLIEPESSDRKTTDLVRLSCIWSTQVIWSRGPAMCLELFWKGFGRSLAKCVCSATHPQSHGSMRWRWVCQKGQAWWHVVLRRMQRQVRLPRVPESTSTWFQVLLRYLFKWSVPRAQVCHCGMCPALNDDIAVVWPLLLQGLRREANESTTRSIRRGVNATRAHCRSRPTCRSAWTVVSEILNASCRLGSRVSKAQR